MADHHEDHHANQDPNAAPMHQDIVADFSFGTVLTATLLGLIAAAAGIVLGVSLINN